MSPLEITVIVLAAAFVVGVAVFSIVRRLRGKGGFCDCGCSSCGGCTSCKQKEEAKKHSPEN